jgi:AraC-like DNA-binding protein
MVCHRCILTLQQILHEIQIPYKEVTIGEIYIENLLTQAQAQELEKKLRAVGFEMINNQQTALIEKIKQLIIRKARNEVTGAEKNWKLSQYIIHHIPNEYTYLSSMFSEVEGRTIEHYFIEQRIEKVKELLVYDQLNLSEIAFQLDYSSVAHLSAQFKKVTGLTPTHFKTIGEQKRKAIDEV